MLILKQSAYCIPFERVESGRTAVCHLILRLYVVISQQSTIYLLKNQFYFYGKVVL